MERAVGRARWRRRWRRPKQRSCSCAQPLLAANPVGLMFACQPGSSVGANRSSSCASQATRALALAVALAVALALALELELELELELGPWRPQAEARRPGGLDRRAPTRGRFAAAAAAPVLVCRFFPLVGLAAQFGQSAARFGGPNNSTGGGHKSCADRSAKSGPTPAAAAAAGTPAAAAAAASVAPIGAGRPAC